MKTEQQVKKKLKQLDEIWYNRTPTENNIVTAVWIDAVRWFLDIKPEDYDKSDFGYN